MLYTSAEANKLLKRIESRISDLKDKEEKSSSFKVASGEDVESLRPKYDFAETQALLDELEEMVRKVKHAINVFNTTHTVPGFGELTIDQALILIPQLTMKLRKLKRMANALPKMRIESLRSVIIDYEVANYDISEAETEYREIQKKLSELQLALDSVNSSETMEIDVELS